MENKTDSQKKISSKIVVIFIILIIIIATLFLMRKSSTEVNDKNGQPVVEGVTPIVITDEATTGFSQDDEISSIEKDLYSTQTNLPN